jgi:exosome complex protein LRP1
MDKAAAGRFIKHAIAQAKTAKGPSEAPATGRSTDVHVPIKVTSKMLARAQYEKDIAMADAENEDEDECLEVWDSEPKDDSEDAGIEGPLKDSKEKGKQKAKDGNILEPPRDLEGTMGWAKRRRPPIDPFAGTPLLLIENFKDSNSRLGYTDDT